MKAESCNCSLKDEDGSIRKFPTSGTQLADQRLPGHARLKVGTVLTTGSEPGPPPQTMTASFQSG